MGLLNSRIQFERMGNDIWPEIHSLWLVASVESLAALLAGLAFAGADASNAVQGTALVNGAREILVEQV